MRLPPNLLFDLDGTILDSLPGIEYSVRSAFGACQLRMREEDLRRIIGPPIRTILSAAGDISDSKTLDALELEFRKSYDSEGWQRTVCFPSAHRVLKATRRIGHRLFVVSNKPRHISLRILEREGMLDLFDSIVTADSRTPRFTDKAEMLCSVMTEYNMNQDQCMFVGDTMEDADAAAAAGIGFVYMTHGYGEPVAAANVPIAYAFDSFSQMLLLVTPEPVCD